MMSEAAAEEVSVLAAIYCGEGEFRLVQQAGRDGLVVRINSTVGGGAGRDVSLLFHLHPRYPSLPPDISVSSPCLSRGQCERVRQKLLERAAASPPGPMVHQLVLWLQQQCEELTEDCGGGEQEEAAAARGGEKEEEWTAVLSLDHIRSLRRYGSLLERWAQQLQLAGRLFLGPSILVILQGARPSIKEFCRLLKTAKVDVDSSGRKCKERMMKVLVETPWSGHSLQGFVVKKCQSVAELTAAFEDISMTELCQQILPSLSG